MPNGTSAAGWGPAGPGLEVVSVAARDRLAADHAARAAGSSASAQATSDSSSAGSGSQGQDGDTSDTAASAGTAGKSAPDGSGVANAGNHRTIVGKLEYLAPGKLIVKPEDGGTDQAFLVSNATQVLGAAAICSDDPDGGVPLGDDGYGTAKCTVAQLEKAAKTGSVTVRVTMSTKSGAGETVEEKYHP